MFVILYLPNLWRKDFCFASANITTPGLVAHDDDANLCEHVSAETGMRLLTTGRSVTGRGVPVRPASCKLVIVRIMPHSNRPMVTCKLGTGDMNNRGVSCGKGRRFDSTRRPQRVAYWQGGNR